MRGDCLRRQGWSVLGRIHTRVVVLTTQNDPTNLAFLYIERSFIFLNNIILAEVWFEGGKVKVLGGAPEE